MSQQSPIFSLSNLDENSLREIVDRKFHFLRNWNDFVIAHGRPLNESELLDAYALGLKKPENIYVCALPTIPLPDSLGDALLFESFESLRVWPIIDGLAAYYINSIAVRTVAEEFRYAKAKALAYVASIERVGFREFLEEHISICRKDGLKASPFEIDAEVKAWKICGG